MGAKFQKNQGKYRGGKRRRMEKFTLSEVSFVDRPAQSPAVMNIQKMADMSVEDLLSPELQKGSIDLVDMVTSSEEDHEHGIRVMETCDGLGVHVSYATGTDNSGMHDHQVILNADGTYTLTENMGHRHAIDGQRIQDIILTRIAMKSDEEQLPESCREARKQLAEAGTAMPDGSFPIRNPFDLGLALKVLDTISKSDHSKVASHILKRAKALDKLPEEGTLAALLKSGTDGGLTDVLEEDSNMDEKLQKALEEIESLKKANAQRDAVIALSAAERAHYDTLDDTKKAEFLEADATKRSNMVEKANVEKASADPVVFTAADGTEYRKSDDPRLVKMAQDRDEDRKETIRLQKAAQDADLTKRAEGDLKNFPGDTDVRKAILKAVDGIEDEDTRTKALDALKAHNARLNSALTPVGTSATPSIEKAAGRSDAEEQLEQLTKARMDKEGEDYFTAYEKVSDANPELLAKAIAG